MACEIPSAENKNGCINTVLFVVVCYVAVMDTVIHLCLA